MVTAVALVEEFAEDVVLHPHSLWLHSRRIRVSINDPTTNAARIAINSPASYVITNNITLHSPHSQSVHTNHTTHPISHHTSSHINITLYITSLYITSLYTTSHHITNHTHNHTTEKRSYQ